MKKILSLLVVLSFSMSQVFAHEANLKSAVDEFIYSVEVDGAEHAEASKEFAVKVNHLLNAGHSWKELLLEAQSNIKDQKLAADMNEVIHSSHLSDAQAQNLLERMVQNSKVQGASWSGEATPLLIGGLVVLLIVLLASSHSSESSEDLTPEELARIEAAIGRYESNRHFNDTF